MNKTMALTTVFATAIFGITLLGLQSTVQAVEQSQREDDAKDQSDNKGDTKSNDRRSPREVREFMEQVMITRLSGELALNDDDTLLLAKKIIQYREEMRTHARHRYHLKRALREAIEEEKDGTEIKEKTNALLQYEKEMEISRIQAFERLSDGCTDWERGKLYLSILDFESYMRRLMDEARQRRKRQRTAEDEAQNGKRNGKRNGPDAKLSAQQNSLINFLIQSEEPLLTDKDS